jgi:hypothetical protein
MGVIKSTGDGIWYFFKGLSYLGAALVTIVTLWVCGGMFGWWK